LQVVTKYLIAKKGRVSIKKSEHIITLTFLAKKNSFYSDSLADFFRGVGTFSNLPPAFSIASTTDLEAA